MGRSIESDRNSFLQVLLKLIPSEVIAVFVFIQGVMPRALLPHLIVAALLLAITPLYLSRVMEVRSRAQLAISTLSLAVWIYAIRGGPIQFIPYPYYQPWFGAVALAIWTLIPPMFLASTRRNGRAAGAGTRTGKRGPAEKGADGATGASAPPAPRKRTRSAPSSGQRSRRPPGRRER
jgi:hypothetical protein